MAAHLGSFVDDVEGVVGPSVWTGGASTPPSWVVLEDGAAALCPSSALPHWQRRMSFFSDTIMRHAWSATA